MRGPSWPLLAALFLLAGSTGAVDEESCESNDSLFQKKYNYPQVWWVVQPADVPGVANTALILRSALTTSPDMFAEQVLLGVARNQTQAIAKSIGYMINANATLGGGCPVPPPPSKFLQIVGDGLASCVRNAADRTILFGNMTDAEMSIPAGGWEERVNSSAVTDVVMAAMFVAGRSCGPPDALSSSTLLAIQEKYINSTCYYAGPILRSVTNNQTDAPPCYNTTFEADILLANTTDPYVAGPLLAAYKQCVVGPPELLNVPTWLGYSFGPVVSIDTSSSSNASSSQTASTGTGDTASTGGGGAAGGSILDGEFDYSTATEGRRLS